MGQHAEVTRVSDEVELRVQTAYNKLERTHQMVAVSEKLLALRTEANVRPASSACWKIFGD